MKDTFTGPMSTGVYRANVNPDREFDLYDSWAEKNLYSLISPVSFSFTIAMPAAFKASGKVTLLGRPSSGGSCTVQFLSTAWGISFDIFGSNWIGVFLSRPDSFYDRKRLTDYIHQLP